MHSIPMLKLGSITDFLKAGVKPAQAVCSITNRQGESINRLVCRWSMSRTLLVAYDDVSGSGRRPNTHSVLHGQ